MFKTQNLYQNDEKWKNTPLGNSNETIGSWGCLLTSVTMMLNGIGYNETPETVNEKMKKAGGFQGAFFIPSMLPYAYPNLVYKDMQPCESSPAPISAIDAALAAGKPVILQVDWNQAAGIQTHFVLVKERKGDDYSLYDPYKYGGDGPDKEVLLTQRYKYQGKTIESEISAVLWFDAAGIPPKPPTPPTPIAVPADSLTLYAIEDDLALRGSPDYNGYLYKRLLAGTKLQCLEPQSKAKPKLGVNGQWLQVQAPDGQQGYVAAWYVSTDPNAKPASTPATPVTPVTTPTTPVTTPTLPIPPGALAFYPTEELSLRSKPIVAPETLIRRIPATEQIISLDPAKDVIARVGVEGQWIRVRDASGREGYVAAWYIRYASGSTAQAAASGVTPAAGSTIKVKATAEGVALRKQQDISDASLIKRVSLGTEFTIIEAGGEKKVGANNQWIKVKDPAGVEGYVAAWFVAF